MSVTDAADAASDRTPTAAVLSAAAVTVAVRAKADRRVALSGVAITFATNMSPNPYLANTSAWPTVAVAMPSTVPPAASCL